MAAQSALLAHDTVIVFAQALTGLGHLRVTHALYHGLPEGAHATLLSSQDETVNYMHRLTSINPAFRRIMEVTQNGRMEDVFTWFARQYFRENTTLIARQLQTILDQRIVHPKRLILVATHSNLAHQLAAIKDEISRKNDIAITLIVVVTDDSPQHMWAVGGADWVIVPSDHTKKELIAYHQTQSALPPTQYMVLPYMVSPLLSTNMTTSQFRRRQREVDPLAEIPLHVSVPISGAAVQLMYIQKLISYLHAASERYVFHIVSHQSSTTARFLSRMSTNQGVTVSVSRSHRDVVELYEELYAKETIAIEITKPSEQAFKSLLTPRMQGGAVLLFSHPVGRQEYDNLAFLHRHGLIPSDADQQALWEMAQNSETPDEGIKAKARHWRGLLLPVHSLAGAKFIIWAHEQKLFVAMMSFAGFPKSPELASDGVAQFWRKIDALV